MPPVPKSVETTPVRAGPVRNTKSAMGNSFEIEHSSEQAGLKSRLKQAVLRGDLQVLIDTIEEIDKFLVGSRTTYSLPTSYRADLEQLLTRNSGAVKIYLGDGGISRLVISKDEGNVEAFVGEVSSESVKARWKEI